MIAAIALLYKIKNMKCHVSKKRKRNAFTFETRYETRYEARLKRAFSSWKSAFFN